MLPRGMEMQCSAKSSRAVGLTASLMHKPDASLPACCKSPIESFEPLQNEFQPRHG
jgi:hypothetical protein